MGALILEIVLGVAILASFFVAYMSARTWQIYQAVIVAFLFLFSVGFFYLSAKALATHEAWRSQISSIEKQTETALRETRQLEDGGDGEAKSNRQLRLDLAKIAADRGGVLYDVAVDGVKDGKVQVKFETPNHGMVPNTVVFIFDQKAADDGGRFQGEFKVVRAVGDAGNSVELAPNLPLTAAQVRRFGNAEGPWTLYTTMPIDDPAMTAAADPDRPLTDYEYLFHQGYVQRSLLSDSIAKLKSNIARIEAAIATSKDEIKYRGDEIENLSSDLERFKREEQLIMAYQQVLEDKLALLREALKSTYAHNRQMDAQRSGTQPGVVGMGVQVDAQMNPPGPQVATP